MNVGIQKVHSNFANRYTEIDASLIVFNCKFYGYIARTLYQYRR